MCFHGVFCEAHAAGPCTTDILQKNGMIHTVRTCTTDALHIMGHYSDVIMGTIASQITSLTSVYSTVYSDVEQRKHQGSVSLAFVRGIHRGPVNSPHKWPVTRNMFPFDDVIMSDNIMAWNIFRITGPLCGESYVFSILRLVHPCAKVMALFLRAWISMSFCQILRNIKTQQ